jgi:hypothetical protein
MTKGFWVASCDVHGTIQSNNEKTKWIKVSPSKHPKVRDGKNGCPFCKRLEKVND